MKRLVEFPLEDGGTVVIEVDEPEPPGGIQRAARADEISETADQTFQAALHKIRPVASSILAEMRGLAESPDEVGVEFGVNLKGTVGAIISSTSVEANFKVSLKWKRDE